MRSQSAIFVDAGYLMAAAATRVTGSSLRRGIKVDYAGLVSELIALVEERAGLPVLRVYWYDAGKNGAAEPEHEKVAVLPKVKLRLGHVGVVGEQKGVDLRIGLDMVGHSRNHAVDVIYLLSGDGDLTEAVEEAQAQGVQVFVLAVPTESGEPHGVSGYLTKAADGVEVLEGSILETTVTKAVAQPRLLADGLAARAARPPSPLDLARRAAPMQETASITAYSGGGGVQPYIAPTYQHDSAEVEQAIIDVVGKAYRAWSATATSEQRKELREGRPTIPRDLDRALLVELSDALGDYYLSDEIRVKLRAQLWVAVDGED